MKTLDRVCRSAAFFAALGFSLGMSACNDHPLEPLDKVISAASNDEIDLPAKTKLDFLFLIDNSGSMCEEQKNLSNNFSIISDFLFNELGQTADYRIAFVNTDLASSKGAYQSSPARPVPALNCKDPITNAPDVPNTADCDDLLVEPVNDRKMKIGPIIKSAPRANFSDLGDLEKKFRCMATIGTGGDAYEKGLEAIRLSLSCDGPNKAAFAACCIDEKDASGRVVRSEYDRQCAGKLPPNVEPDFLRPDAVLVVIILSDEVDCSDPASNPGKSRRAICKYGPGDGDGNGAPDGYRDTALCPGGNQAECFRNECGGLSGEDCYARRCSIPRNENSNCEWLRDELTPVSDYVDFLESLKADPRNQIFVASIVGKRLYLDLEETTEITYNPPAVPRNPACDPDAPEYDPNISLEVCCPQGRCEGKIAPTCSSENGVAFSGRRYYALAEAFGQNGLGCPAGAPGNGEACLSICENDFSAPLQEIKRRITQILGSYCLNKPPVCQLLDTEADGVEGTVGEVRDCTEEERGNGENFKRTVRVKMRCLNSIAQGGACEEVFDQRVLEPGEWTVETRADDPQLPCVGGVRIRLTQPPPAGAEVSIEFKVDVNQQLQGRPADAGVSGEDGGGISLSDDGGSIQLPEDDGGITLPDAQ